MTYYCQINAVSACISIMDNIHYILTKNATHGRKAQGGGGGGGDDLELVIFFIPYNLNMQLTRRVANERKINT